MGVMTNRRLAFIWLVIFVALCAVTYFTRDKKLIIDLPEEISQAKAGDTLIILFINKDSLSLGFKR